MDGLQDLSEWTIFSKKKKKKEKKKKKIGMVLHQRNYNVVITQREMLTLLMPSVAKQFS